jgi:cellulose synthase/poly-beta-1,6-N-acetylglucosamine synthase-like glycosyltransferase
MGNKKLTLSVIIPTFNEEGYIGDCLEAIAQQTEMPERVIVVDNNSSDRTVEIAKSFNFVTILHEKTQGVRFARNTGFAHGKTDLIGRIDADTKLSRVWAQTTRHIFQSENRIDAATGPCSYYDMPLEKVSLRIDKSLRRSVFMLGEMPVLYGSNMVIRRRAWDEIKADLCMSGEMYEDYDVSIHMKEYGLITVYDKHLVVAVSARRLDDNPRSFARNMRLHTHTFAVHGMKSTIASVSRVGYLSVYPPLKLLRSAYDNDKGRLSIRKALARNALARPDSKNY